MIICAFFTSCSSDSEDYDQYHDWAKRNAAWFETVADSARTAISAAQAQYGDTWEQHCDWRMYKSLFKSQELQRGIVGDSICVHILKNGNGIYSPASNDTVRIDFRGWLIPTTKADGTTEELVFSQSYYGDFDPSTAAPQKACVSAFTQGFATALQYMVEGDDWMVYIPQELFYGSNKNGLIPAYSSARFRIHMAGVYHVGEIVPSWN